MWEYRAMGGNRLDLPLGVASLVDFLEGAGNADFGQGEMAVRPVRVSLSQLVLRRRIQTSGSSWLRMT